MARNTAHRMSDALESHLVHERRNRPQGPSPVDLVSVQSQLAYGYAGNSAAVPVLRMLGVRVAEVPTTLLSNTPFYATLRGRVLPADWLADLLRGLDERGVSARAPMAVSGYFGSVANGEAFADWIERHHHARLLLAGRGENAAAVFFEGFAGWITAQPGIDQSG